jgi:hypothetical protein
MLKHLNTYFVGIVICLINSHTRLKPAESIKQPYPHKKCFFPHQEEKCFDF